MAWGGGGAASWLVSEGVGGQEEEEEEGVMVMCSSGCWQAGGHRCRCEGPGPPSRILVSHGC